MSDCSSVKKIIYRKYVLKNYSKHSPSGGGLPNFTTTHSFEYNPVDYIIGFASEDYNPNGEGTGHFNPTWDLDTLRPEIWKKLKETNPNARVVISIGGDMGTDSPFNPSEKQAWIATAVNSLTEIIHFYDDANYKNLIDGIDIRYNSVKSSADDFSYCIGEVIKSLKTDPHLTIKVVSIAPGEYTQSYYQKLYIENQNYIDLVDYLFKTIDDIVSFYKKLVADYSPAAVIPGCLYPSFQGDTVQEAVIHLVELDLAPGYFNY